MFSRLALVSGSRRKVGPKLDRNSLQVGQRSVQEAPRNVSNEFPRALFGGFKKLQKRPLGGFKKGQNGPPGPEGPGGLNLVDLGVPKAPPMGALLGSKLAPKAS